MDTHPNKTLLSGGTDGRFFITYKVAELKLNKVDDNNGRVEYIIIGYFCIKKSLMQSS